ncbi:hypothetical protein [Streptomyces sulphureus]|uniref:hypothetical protein n=1 Tax=Streptomyces sulphureus TaxID=47758 RepID=UPI00035E6A4F|nr:hypothetical protein [Streptomyces sulphureus]
MVSVPELKEAEPQKWRDAAEDALAAARRCGSMSALAEEEVAATLLQCWAGDTGEAARRRFVQHAEDFEAAKLVLKKLVRTYDDLADAVETAKADLVGGLSYADSHDLVVDDSGRVQLATPIMTAPGDDSHFGPLDHAAEAIGDALTKATEADRTATAALRLLGAMTDITDPALAREALRQDSPLAVALRLQNAGGGDHSINVSSSQLAAVEQAARETGVSKKLLLATLWQEQQWYQHIDGSPNGPASFFGRPFNWLLSQTIKPDKSLGITHIKPDTARTVMENHPDAFLDTENNRLSEMDDSQLAKYIEENPNEAIRLSAYHYSDLREQSEYGARTDKDLFLLYAADTPDVRELNEQYGDESEPRGGDIRTRGENWDRISPRLDDAMAWEHLTEAERLEAMEQLESQTPDGQYVYLEPIYGDGISMGTGTDTGTDRWEPEPTPSPSANPPPTPPEGD